MPTTRRRTVNAISRPIAVRIAVRAVAVHMALAVAFGRRRSRREDAFDLLAETLLAFARPRQAAVAEEAEVAEATLEEMVRRDSTGGLVIRQHAREVDPA